MPLRQTNLKGDSLLQCFRYMFDKPESLLSLAFSQFLPFFVYSWENLEFHWTSGCKSIVLQQPIRVGREIRLASSLARALDPWRSPKGLWALGTRMTSAQPRPQGLLLVQNGGRRNPWPRLLEYSKNRGVFCHVTHEEMAFSEVVPSVWRPCFFSAIGIRCPNETKTFHRVYLTKF